MCSFHSFSQLGELMSQQHSAGHRSRKPALVSAFAGPTLFMLFLTIRLLTPLQALLFLQHVPLPGWNQPTLFLFSHTQTFNLLKMPAETAGLCNVLPEMIAPAPWPGTGKTKHLVHSACEENLFLLLSSQGLYPSLPVSAVMWLSVFKSYKPLSDPKLRSETCCGIV